MFRLIERSLDQIHNIVLVRLANTHIIGFRTVYKIMLILKITFNYIDRCN
jgi:hypothetical protein